MMMNLYDNPTNYLQVGEKLISLILILFLIYYSNNRLFLRENYEVFTQDTVFVREKYKTKQAENIFEIYDTTIPSDIMINFIESMNDLLSCNI